MMGFSSIINNEGEEEEESEAPTLSFEAPQPKRILLDLDITLPDIPLPPIQASCGPLPAPESQTCSQNIRRAASSPDQHSQEGCTDHQPNPNTSVLPEGTQQLCPSLWLRDFRSEEPEEFQSWREMYLYHQEAREREQVTAAQTIASAPAHNAQANNTLPLESPPRAPQEGHWRQENLGTGGALLPENTNINPVPYTSWESPTSTPSQAPEVREELQYYVPGSFRVWDVSFRAKFSWFPILRKPAVKRMVTSCVFLIFGVPGLGHRRQLTETETRA
ncbi:transcription elongation factor b polypeptide hypothetical protein [Limosa lapponica baueri]|uniref:Uncharacterized protein n=1 Tax=Limosa lapponica baueri TaxID=1758121 RepID=A0A2I0T3H1_LIMLA|nr:transcription elongation factor b polypeptide hypothetical protein [Limosa lapponica baueri]